MSPKRLFLLTFALLLSLAACGGGDDDDESVDAGAGGGATRPWIAGDWVLVTMTVDGADVAIPADAAIELTIAGPDSVSGNAGCNSFGGTVTTLFDDDRDGGSLEFGDVAMTEMACEVLDFEGRYMEALLATTEWELAPPSGLVLRGDGLELVYGIGAKPADVPFENTEWRFDTIYGGEGVERTASSTRADKPQVTAVFTAGMVTLNAKDCGPVVLEAEDTTGGQEGPISFNGGQQAIALCQDPESNMIPAIQGLADATAYQVFDGRLTFIGLPGETVSFVATDG